MLAIYGGFGEKMVIFGIGTRRAFQEHSACSASSTESHDDRYVNIQILRQFLMRKILKIKTFKIIHHLRITK